jgi:hypothetical protein
VISFSLENLARSRSKDNGWSLPELLLDPAWQRKARSRFLPLVFFTS